MNLGSFFKSTFGKFVLGLALVGSVIWIFRAGFGLGQWLYRAVH